MAIICTECFLLLLGIAPTPNKHGSYAGGRNGKQHSSDSEKRAHYAYRKQDKKRVQPRCFANDFRIDVV